MLGAAATAQADTPSPVQRVADGDYAHFGQVALTTPDNAGDIANLGIIVGRDAVASSTQAAACTSASACCWPSAAITDKPIRYVINTHEHPGPRFRQCRHAIRCDIRRSSQSAGGTRRSAAPIICAPIANSSARRRSPPSGSFRRPCWWIPRPRWTSATGVCGSPPGHRPRIPTAISRCWTKRPACCSPATWSSSNTCRWSTAA